MHQICDGYNPRVRMGNWFQQSYSVNQPARMNPQKASRDAQIDIGYIDAHLKLRPLNRVARLPPWNTSGLVDAPQFKNMNNTSTMKQNFDISVNGNYFHRWKPFVYDKNSASGAENENNIKVNQCKRDYKLFDASNVSELLNQRASDVSSFKSSIVPAKHLQQKELLKTIYQMDISDKGTNLQSSFTDKKQLQNNGISTLQKPVFRRIRSEITLKNVPPFQTYK